MKRRAFVVAGGSCLAQLGWARNGLAREPAGRIVAQEPWGTLQDLGGGVWAMISTPLQDRTTLCNGGIVAGSRATMVFEAFGSARGAQWMSEQARRLTGRWPTHVVLSHFHGDHVAGLDGYRSDDATPAIRATERTVELVGGGNNPPGLLADVDLMRGAFELDLGGLSVAATPRDGHTPSDVTVSVDGGRVVFCGDLVWNNMFPNYRDATPSRLSRAVRAVAADEGRQFVPGHGVMADRSDLDRYLAVIDAVEVAGRRAAERGESAADAAVRFNLPAGVGEWMRFNPRYYEVAIGAWLRELGA